MSTTTCGCRPAFTPTGQRSRDPAPDARYGLGASAANYLLGVTAPIGKLRGRFFNYHDIPVICTYHPSFLLRSPTHQNKAAVWDDMKKLLTKMGKPIPQGKKKEEE